MTPTMRATAQGRTVAIVGDVYRFLATGEDTNDRCALWEALVPPGGGPPPHVHGREEEGFYVSEGEITFTVKGDGERVVPAAGAFSVVEFCKVDRADRFWFTVAGECSRLPGVPGSGPPWRIPG